MLSCRGRYPDIPFAGYIEDADGRGHRVAQCVHVHPRTQYTRLIRYTSTCLTCYAELVAGKRRVGEMDC
jgi:hypothetical protein